MDDNNKPFVACKDAVDGINITPYGVFLELWTIFWNGKQRSQKHLDCVIRIGGKERIFNRGSSANEELLAVVVIRDVGGRKLIGVRSYKREEKDGCFLVLGIIIERNFESNIRFDNG